MYTCRVCLSSLALAFPHPHAHTHTDTHMGTHTHTRTCERNVMFKARLFAGSEESESTKIVLFLFPFFQSRIIQRKFHNSGQLEKNDPNPGESQNSAFSFLNLAPPNTHTLPPVNAYEVKTNPFHRAGLMNENYCHVPQNNFAATGTLPSLRPSLSPGIRKTKKEAACSDSLT